jgi:signal transduction histidine kinase
MTIFRKGLLLIAVPLLFQLVFIGLLLRILDEGDRAERWTLHTKEVIARTEKTYGQLALVQGASRGYVLSTTRPFADDEQAAVRAVRAEFDAIEHLLADNQPQQLRIREARAAAEEMIRWSVEQADWANSGHREQAIARVANLEGRTKLANVRKKLNDFLVVEEQLDRDRTRMLARSRSEERWAIGLGTLGMSLATIFAAYYFSKSISGRLMVVTRNAELLAENKPLSKPIHGRDEIRKLDQVMHEASRRLIEADQTEARYKAELEERAAELARTNETLRQQTQENEMFVYSVSHDLRSPLVNLQGFSRELQYAVQDLKNLLADSRIPDEVRRPAHEVMEQDISASLKFIRTAVTRASGIIDALLRLSRAGRVEYRWQLVDIAGAMQRIVDAMRSTIQERKAEVVINDLAPAWGDATALEQMFGNLVGNAINYLDVNRNGRVEIGMLNQGQPDEYQRRIYYIKDSGLGIPASYLSKVFVAFQRLHGGVARGEGIGLALVRRVVERHNGRVWVESTQGVGSTFFVALPADDPTVCSTKVDSETNEAPSGGTSS